MAIFLNFIIFLPSSSVCIFHYTWIHSCIMGNRDDNNHNIAPHFEIFRVIIVNCP